MTELLRAVLKSRLSFVVRQNSVQALTCMKGSVVRRNNLRQISFCEALWWARFGQGFGEF